MMFGESTSRCDKILIDVWIIILPQDPFAGKEFFVPEAFPILTGKAVTIELKELGETEGKERAAFGRGIERRPFPLTTPPGGMASRRDAIRG